MRDVQAEDGASPISATSTARAPRLTGVLLLIAALVWAADQLTKQWALARFVQGEAEPFIGRLLQFTLVFNPGAAFSLGTAFTPVLTVIMASIAVAILVAATRVRSAWWAVSLGFLLGGALGNLTDRLARPPGFAHGHVVDFLMLPNFPVFNVADSFITTAAVCIFVAALRDIPLSGPRAGATVDADDAEAGEDPGPVGEVGAGGREGGRERPRSGVSDDGMTRG